MLGTSDAWWMSHSSQQTSEPGYYIVDCRICIYADKVGGPKRVQKCADVIMDGLLAIWGVKTKRLQKKTEAEGMSKWVESIFKIVLYSSSNEKESAICSSFL